MSLSFSKECDPSRDECEMGEECIQGICTKVQTLLRNEEDLYDENGESLWTDKSDHLVAKAEVQLEKYLPWTCECGKVNEMYPSGCELCLQHNPSYPIDTTRSDAQKKRIEERRLRKERENKNQKGGYYYKKYKKYKNLNKTRN